MPDQKKESLSLVFAFCLLFSACFLSYETASAQEESSKSANPVQGKQLFKHYCAVCHGLTGKGNGVNADNLDPHPADLTSREVVSLSDKEIYDVIDEGGAAVELSAAMPPWGRTLTKEQIQSLIAYIRTLSGSGAKASKAEKEVRFSDLKRGGDSDCQICHVRQDRLRPIAPNLSYEGSKFNREWLTVFLKDPGRIRPIGYTPLTKSKMPNFQLTEDEVAALTEFLLTQKDEGTSAVVLTGVDPSNAAEVEKGRRLFIDKYACEACHKIGQEGAGGIVGPDLSDAAIRLRPEWIYSWIKNPQAFRPDSPMPNFGVPDDELRQLISYILSAGKNAPKVSAVSGQAGNPDLIKRGERLLKEKNCVGCHTLDPINSQSRKQEKGKDLLPRS